MFSCDELTTVVSLSWRVSLLKDLSFCWARSQFKSSQNFDIVCLVLGELLVSWLRAHDSNAVPLTT